jgi:hypothetical protein
MILIIEEHEGHEGIGDIWLIAEALGWKKPSEEEGSPDEWSAELADAYEQDALEHIASRGITVMGQEYDTVLTDFEIITKTSENFS